MEPLQQEENIYVYLVRAKNGECFWTTMVYEPLKDNFDWDQIEELKNLPTDYLPDDTLAGRDYF